jgi:beta-lactamase class D
MNSSKFMVKLLGILLLVAIVLSCQSPQSEEAALEGPAKPVQRKASPAFQTLLDSLNLTGTILVFDEAEATYHANNFEKASTGHLPASTFKIPNTIIALETGVASGPEHLFKWDGSDRWLDAWEQDLTLKEAFSVSCVPCYQEVARAVGPQRMRTELARMGYSGMVFDTLTVDNFWLQGNSRITPQEQINFLRRIYHAELPIRPATQHAIRDIMVMEKTDDYTLSGKTGWSINGENNNGWFVGFVERDDKVYYFATNVEPGLGFNMDGFAAARVRVTRLALAGLGIL